LCGRPGPPRRGVRDALGSRRRRPRAHAPPAVRRPTARGTGVLDLARVPIARAVRDFVPARGQGRPVRPLSGAAHLAGARRPADPDSHQPVPHGSDGPPRRGVVDLPFDPTLAGGPIRIAWHSLWSLVGMGAGSWVSFRLARRLVKDERIYPFAIAVVIGGLVGARAGHIADNWPYYSAHPDQLLAFWNGGVAVASAPIGSAIG